MFIEYPQHTAIPPPLPQWYSDLNGTDLTQLYSPSMGKKSNSVYALVLCRRNHES